MVVGDGDGLRHHVGIHGRELCGRLLCREQSVFRRVGGHAYRSGRRSGRTSLALHHLRHGNLVEQTLEVRLEGTANHHGSR